MGLKVGCSHYDAESFTVELLRLPRWDILREVCHRIGEIRIGSGIDELPEQMIGPVSEGQASTDSKGAWYGELRKLSLRFYEVFVTGGLSSRLNLSAQL